MNKSKVLDAVPASVRKPVVSSRLAQGLMTKGQPFACVGGLEARAAAAAKSRFVRLPHEPEDARMTGVTRSLNRRLLALNVKGSRFSGFVLNDARIA